MPPMRLLKMGYTRVSSAGLTRSFFNWKVFSMRSGKLQTRITPMSE